MKGAACVLHVNGQGLWEAKRRARMCRRRGIKQKSVPGAEMIVPAGDRVSQTARHMAVSREAASKSIRQSVGSRPGELIRRSRSFRPLLLPFKSTERWKCGRYSFAKLFQAAEDLDEGLWE